MTDMVKICHIRICHRLTDFGVKPTINRLGRPLPNFDNFIQINASLNAQAIQHINQLFSGQVAARARRIRTTA